MAWSQQQESALRDITRWLNDKHAPQVFRMFGYAGSGKTTLAKEIASRAKGRPIFGAFTGKAAMVLRSKGCEGASTIHSMIYKPLPDDESGNVEFVLNPDSPVSTAGLVIIDEVSMVGADLARDLLSFGTRILVLGDPAQLPPVHGEGFFINGKPEVMLSEIHRQAADNPIIHMSMLVREGKRLKVGTYGDSQVVRRAEMHQDSLREIVLGADQVLCGLNRTRQMYNGRIRQLSGMAAVDLAGNLDPAPAVGERLVCLRNNNEKGLLNGGLWDVEQVTGSGQTINMIVKSADVPDMPTVDVSVPVEFFTGEEKQLPWKVRRDNDEFTFGYVLTVHKSQGSQWNDVLVFDESSAFRDDAAKHLYTAITRAAERVTVII